MRQVSIELNERSRQFIEEHMATGRYDSMDEVVQEGLRLLKDHQARLQALREALIAGEKSGLAGPFDIDMFLAQRRAEWQMRQDKRRS